MTLASTATSHRGPSLDGFSHEVLFYAGADDFVRRMAAFIREGLAAGEPVLVMVTADKIDLLRAELGDEAENVTFADMASLGRNPGRIISAWNEFAAEMGGDGRRLRGIGEPIWAGRSDDEMVECQHHESLINLAFDQASGFRLMCPYDTESLPPDVIEEARRSHPRILDGDTISPCESYRGVEAIGMLEDPLPAPRGTSLAIGFQQSTLDRVRNIVRRHARDAGLEPARADDLVISVNEAATNSVMHGGGGGVVRMWRNGAAIVCEIRDRGRIHEPLVGRVRPAPGTPGGRGLWLAHQLCDLVQLRSRGDGTVVRLHLQLS